MTWESGDVSKFVKDIVRERSADTIVAAGGDGTLNEVVAALIKVRGGAVDVCVYVCGCVCACVCGCRMPCRCVWIRLAAAWRLCCATGSNDNGTGTQSPRHGTQQGQTVTQLGPKPGPIRRQEGGHPGSASDPLHPLLLPLLPLPLLLPAAAVQGASQHCGGAAAHGHIQRLRGGDRAAAGGCVCVCVGGGG